MSSKLTVAVADGDRLMAAGLRHILAAEFEMVDAVADENPMSEAALRQADVVVINLPGDALAAVSELRRTAPETRTVLLNQPDDPERCLKAIAAGVNGYLLVGTDPDELVFAVRSVARDGVYISPSLNGELLRRTAAAPASGAAKAAAHNGGGIRVAIADDDIVIRQGLQAALTAVGVEVAALAEDGLQAVRLALQHRPDVVLMDLMMPGMDGVEATRAIVRRWPAARILIVSSSRLPEQILPAIQAGARGYVAKGLDLDEYVDALSRVHRGELSFPDDIARHEPSPELTRREAEVVRLVARGLENQEIADRLFISVVTVRTHVRNVMEKLGFANRVELVLHALRSGLAKLEDVRER